MAQGQDQGTMSGSTKKHTPQPHRPRLSRRAKPFESVLELETVEWKGAEPSRQTSGLIVIRNHRTPPKNWSGREAACVAIIDAWLQTAEEPCSLEGALGLNLGEEGSLLEYRWPRRLAWSDLPVVHDAEFKLRTLMPVRLDANGEDTDHTQVRVVSQEGLPPATQAAVAMDIEDCRALLFDVGAMPQAEAIASVAEAFRIYRNPGTALPLLVGWFDGVHVHSLQADDLSAARSSVRAHHRFVWSHVVNACVIMRRAAVEAQSGATDTEKCDAKSAFRLFDTLGSGLATPEALQLLHACRTLKEPLSDVEMAQLRLASAQSSERPGSTLTATWSAMCRATPYFEMDDSGRKGNGGREVWQGTGRYPVYVGPMTDDICDHTEPKSLTMAMIYLSANAFLALDAAGQTRVTTLAARFLDIIGNASCDPDVLLRWRTPQGFLGTEADVPAMDRWLHRTFRAVKRRVQHLPDGGPLRRRLRSWELDGSHTDDLPDDPLPQPPAVPERYHAQVIRGRVMLVTQDRLRDGTPLCQALKELQMRSREPELNSIPMSDVMGRGQEPLTMAYFVRTEPGIFQLLVYGGLVLTRPEVPAYQQGILSIETMAGPDGQREPVVELSESIEAAARRGIEALSTVLASEPSMSAYGIWLVPA